MEDWCLVLPSGRSIRHQKLDNKNKRWVGYNLLGQNNFLQHCNQEHCMRDPTRRNCKDKGRNQHIFHFLQQKKKTSFVSLVLPYRFVIEATATNNSGMKVVGENVKIFIVETGLWARIVVSKAPLYESTQQFRPLKDNETLCNHFSQTLEGKWYVNFLLTMIMFPSLVCCVHKSCDLGKDYQQNQCTCRSNSWQPHKKSYCSQFQCIQSHIYRTRLPRTHHGQNNYSRLCKLADCSSLQ